MENSLMIYEAHRALAESVKGSYALQLGNGSTVDLKRGVDFDNPVVKSGKNAGKKAFDKPILQKAGAEKIAFGFGLLQQYELVSKVEQYDGQNSYFAYTVRCDLVKLGPNGEKVVVSNSYGHANTAEARNGFKAAADSANGSLKMAQKRALVGAALAISGLSDLFYQDIDNDSFMAEAGNITKARDDDPISSKQITRIYALAGSLGLTTPEAKNIIQAMGYGSTKDIKVKDYDSVIEAVKKAAEKNA